MEKRTILILSTAHLSAATAALLTTKDVKNWPCVGGPYGQHGWFVYAHDENGEGKDYIPEDLFAVMQYAKTQGCHNILFDCDSDPIEQLPKFSWDGVDIGKSAYERATDLLSESLDAWEDEEESVMEEHEDLIADLNAFFEENRP